MQSGQFFELDKTSYLHKGEVVFRYTKSKSEEHKPTYPIYLSFKSTRIDFYYHGYVTVNNKKLQNNNETDLPELFETNILSLPLSTQASVVNELNDKLETIFDEKFPATNNYQLQAEIKKNRFPAYSNLKAFYLSENTNEDKRLLLRVLLLDFIFDMQHTDLFKACPFYENAKKLLQENLFFEAIASKAKFYFLVENSTSRKINKENKNTTSLSFDYYGDNQYNNELNKAFNRWLNILQKPSADKPIDCVKKKSWFVKRKEYWFNNIEDELLKAHINELEIKPSILQFYKKQVNINKSKQKKEKGNPLLQTLNEIWKRFSKNDRKESLNWLLNRYNLLYTLKLLFHNLWVWILAFTIISFSVIYYSNKHYSFSANILFEFPTIFFGITLLFSFFKRRSLTFLFKFIIFNLIIILVSGWLMIFDIDTLRNSFFSSEIISIKSLLIIIIPLILTAGLIYGNEREFRQTNKKISSLTKSIILILLSLFYSFNISLISTHIFASERLSQEYFLENFWSSIDTKGSLSNKKSYMKLDANEMEIMDTIYLLTNRDNLIKDTSILASKKKISTRKNEIFYNHLNKVYLPKSKKPIKREVRIFNETFDFFPALVIYNAILSLFIGVFVQIIISRKPITG